MPRRLPFRLKKMGKFYGVWYERGLDGKRVNLRTEDANIALERSKLVRKGLPFDDDSEAERVANAIHPRHAETEDAKTPPVVEPAAPPAPGLGKGLSGPPPLHQAHSAPPALSPIPSTENTAGDAGKPQEVHPDGYIPPPPGFADAMRAAAAGAESSSAAAAEDDEEPASDADSREFFEEALDEAADMAVELQLVFQAWLIKKRAKMQASPVPPEAKVRARGRKLWKKAFREMLPEDLPKIPAWAAAPLAVLVMGLPVQLEGAVDLPPDAPAEGAGPAAAPAEAVSTS